MGTAAFAVPSLEGLADSRHDLLAVYTQPPRPAGRGKREQRTDVHEAASALGLPVRTPATLKTAEVQAAFTALELDVAVVGAYGLLLPQAILDAPRHGCLNLHGSLLPRWRGAAPVERAVEAGDAETGVMIFQMEAGLDTGPVFVERRLPIGARDTAPALRTALADLAARLLLPLLDDLEAGRAIAAPQPPTGATYANKLDKQEFRIDWQAPAALLERRVRAFHPNAWCQVGAQRLRVLAADVVAGSGPPGTVLDAALTVACGEGALRLTEVQPSGKRPMASDAYLRGRPIDSGSRLD
ncbi:MAG: methionyl-tRNA formyltransferase [Pseudomonadota bacterium]